MTCFCVCLYLTSDQLQVDVKAICVQLDPYKTVKIKVCFKTEPKRKPKPQSQESKMRSPNMRFDQTARHNAFKPTCHSQSTMSPYALLTLIRGLFMEFHSYSRSTVQTVQTVQTMIDILQQYQTCLHVVLTSYVAFVRQHHGRNIYLMHLKKYHHHV